MVSMGVSDFVMTMALVLLVIGVIVLGFGIFTLVKKVLGKELNLIAEQTAKIAQKGVTEEISGLVGNARALIEVLNEMVKTTTGISIFLILFGTLLMAGAYLLVKSIG
ncbi:MAG TPA: hypothetical protein PLV27_08560 [Anaerolineaceae bacterium]|nr:hypothetical protein [Anaerolineaceae bacterium]HOV07294.1 hypothetical protein [Anaerolineaceae bacterium]